MLKVVEEESNRKSEALVSLDDLAREGARRMLVSALAAEVEEYVSAHKHERDDAGRALVVRNGKARARQVTMGSGTVEIEAPRVNDKRVDEDGERQRFTSAILLPYMRRSPKVTEVLPILYLRGLSTGDFKPALESLLGESASGLSPSAITRMTTEWEEEHALFRKRSLADRDFVYIWADGIHVNVRLDDDRVCLLVVMGARPDGEKEVIAIEDGHRESKESWLGLLRDLKARGMQAPAVAVGDGALGFWAAVREVWPDTREQRCWFHRLGNVLDKLPKSGAVEGQSCAARDHVRRRTRGCTQGDRVLRDDVRREAPQGGRVASQGRGEAAHLLRLPGRALEAPAHQQRDRVDLRDRAFADPCDQGTGLPVEGAHHGLQAAAASAGAMATTRWAPTASPRPCPREVRRRSSSGEKQVGGESRLIMHGRSTTFDNTSRRHC